MTAAVTKREALLAALNWLGCYEGTQGPLLYRIDQDDFDAEAEQIPADMVAAFYEMDRQIRSLDKKHNRAATIRYATKEYGMTPQEVRAALRRMK
jgi:multidrug resistance efflux pump